MACKRRLNNKNLFGGTKVSRCGYLDPSLLDVQANFSKSWRYPLLIGGIRSCGIEALSNLVPHLEQLHMLALWGRLWSRLGFTFWNGFKLPIPWDKTGSKGA